MGGVKRFIRKAIPNEIKRPFNQIQGFINRAIPREIKPFVKIAGGMALGNYVFAPLLRTAGSAIGAGVTASSGIGSVVGNVLTSTAAAQGLGAAALSGDTGWKNVALALLPGAVEGKTFLGTTISPVIARAMAVGGGISGDYRQALMSGVTAGALESAFNSKMGEFITKHASSYGLGDVQGLKEALIAGGSVSLYESQRQGLIYLQEQLQRNYDQFYKEEMEKARLAELAAIKAEEARINALNAQEEELERQRLEYLAQEQAKAEERKRIEAPLRNKFALRRMRARKMLEELRETHDGLAARLGELPLAA